MVSIDNAQLDGRFDDETQMRPIRATRFHLDRIRSQIELSVRRYSTWSDYEENACMMLKEDCNILAAHWVKIYKFIIETGKINENGQFESWARYKENVIPEGKVFIRGNFGKWVDYAAACQADLEAKCLIVEKGEYDAE